jgi:hypothetical protein
MGRISFIDTTLKKQVISFTITPELILILKEKCKNRNKSRSFLINECLEKCLKGR